MKKGATAAVPLIAMCARIAPTAQTGMFILLMNTSTPLPSWPVLDAFKRIASTEGLWIINSHITPTKVAFVIKSCKARDSNFTYLEEAIEA